MKRYLLILAGIAMLFACKQEEDPDNGNGNGNGNDNGGQDKVELSLSAEKMVFSSFGGEQAVEVTTNQASWKADVADECKDWLSVTTSGNTVKVTAAENTTADELTGLVAVSAGDKIVTLTVTQDGAEPNASDVEGTTVSYTLAEGTTIAPKGMAQYITSLNKDQRYFILSKDTPEELMPKKGQKIIVNRATKVLPEGLLAKIYTIKDTENGYRVDYAQLELGDVFETLDLSSEGLAGEVTGVEDSEGTPMSFIQTKVASNDHFHLELPNVQWHLSDEVHVTPKMETDIWLKMVLKMSDYGISFFSCKADAVVDFGADLEFSVEEKLFKEPFHLATVYLAAIPVGPVLLTPTVDFYGIFNVAGKFSITAKYRSSVSASGELYWDSVSGGKTPKFNFELPSLSDVSIEPGTSVSTTVSLGAAVGFGIGIYGEVVNASLRINAYNDIELSGDLDFATWATSSPWDSMSSFIGDAKISSALKFDADFSVRFMGVEAISLEAPATIEYKYLEERIFPGVNQHLECVQDSQDSFTFRTTVDEPSLFSGVSGSKFGELVLLYKERDNDAAEWKSVPYNMTEEKAEALKRNPDNKQPIEAKVTGLVPGRYYTCMTGWKYGSGMIAIGEEVSVLVMNTLAYDALYAILNDLRACASGTWQGCNWGDEGVKVTELKYVDLGLKDDNANDFNVTITIPAAWQFNGNFIVGNHSPSSNFKWYVSFRGGMRYFNTINVQDRQFTGSFYYSPQDSPGYIPFETKNFICRSEYVHDYPITTEKFDVSGSGIVSFYFPTFRSPTDDNPAFPSEIIADNCPDLKSIEIQVPKGKKLERFSAKNCKMTDYFTLRVNGSISTEAIKGMGDLTKTSARRLYIEKDNDMSSVTIGPGPTMVLLYDVKDVTVSGASDLVTIDVNPYEDSGVYGLSVSDCPKLQALTAYSNDMTSFNISNVPVITRLVLSGKMGGLVPDVFDQIRSRNGQLEYLRRYNYEYERQPVFYGEDPWEQQYEQWKNDTKSHDGLVFQRYLYTTYTDDGYTWTEVTCKVWSYDHGYGFYYSGEPSRGWHLSKDELPLF